MGYREKVRILAETAKINSDKSGYDDLQFISQCLENISSYHNFVIDMEQKMDIQKFRLDESDWRDWLSDQNGSRIIKHKAMIDSVIMVNRYARNNNIEPLYDGKIDETLRYDDADTRFGIAAFADDYCSEIFQAGIKQNVATPHKQIINELLNKAENIQQSDESEIQNVK